MSYLENQIMEWGTNKVSDHNRSSLRVENDQIERKSRMADGTLRKYVVSVKKKWSCSWEDLPSHNDSVGSGTVDGGMSGTEMLEFYEDNINQPFIMTLKDGLGNEETYNVMIESFSYDIKKRGTVDLWDVNVSIEEI